MRAVLRVTPQRKFMHRHPVRTLRCSPAVMRGHNMSKSKSVSVLAITTVLFALTVSVRTTNVGSAPKRAHVVILSTTDMHGRIFPIDYYTNKYDNVGIAKVSTLVKDER